MHSDETRAQFEAFSQNLLQVAYDFVDHSDEVSDIWIYTSMETGAVICVPVYRINGTVCGAIDVDKHLSTPVDALGNISELYNEFITEGGDFSDGFDEADRPTRVIVHYVVAEESMDATFNYDAIGTANDDDVTDQDVYEAWLARLVATGEDAA